MRRSSPSRGASLALDAARRELRALYAEVDALLEPFRCEGTTECCRFAITGREPYPTAVELDAVQRAIAAVGGPRAAFGGGRHLPLARDGRCPLLDAAGRCRIYESRPFGCRTFFCERVEGPGKLPRRELLALGARVAALSARAFPADPAARPLTRALEALGAGR
jgi:Fe-S-cluster containining protein